MNPRVGQVSALFDNIKIELFFIKGERNILIDTGTREMPRKDVLPELKAFGLTFSDIDFILNTHGHSDHTAGNSAVKNAGSAQLCIHMLDAPFLHDPESCFERYFSPVVKAMERSVPAEKKAFLESYGPPMAPDWELEEGDVIDCGRGIKLCVVHIPGHTPGSVGFYWEREEILFAGDALGGLYVGNGKLPIISDLPAYTDSIRRLRDIPINILLCSHHYRSLHLAAGPVRTGKEVGVYLRDCHEFAAGLDEAVRKMAPRAGDMKFMQLADEVIARLPAEMGFMPMTQAQPPLFFSAQTIYFHLLRLNGFVSP